MGAKNPDYLSVSELADSVQKSKQWIYRLVKTDSEFSKYVVTVDGKQKIKKAAITEFFGYTENGKPEDPLVTILKDQISSQKQQIDSLQRTIDNLSEMLKAEQVLHGQTSARLQQATLLIEDLRKQAAPENAEEPVQQAAPEPERSEKPQTEQSVSGEPERSDTPLTFGQRLKNLFRRK